MGRNLSPKCKQCRRIGEKMFLKGERCATPKCAIVKRNYAPGMHGNKQKRKLSNYGLQLQEKQKAKKEYRLMEKQFKLTFDKAQNQAGDAGNNFMRLLEIRLDNVIYRLGFTASRNQARELVSHGHFLVNNKKVDIPSLSLKTGDIIKIKERSKKMKLFGSLAEKLKKAEIPGWLNFNAADMSGKVLRLPAQGDIKTTINAQTIVEFYSR